MSDGTCLSIAVRAAYSDCFNDNSKTTARPQESNVVFEDGILQYGLYCGQLESSYSNRRSWLSVYRKCCVDTTRLSGRLNSRQ
jgi:hypothetical protein